MRMSGIALAFTVALIRSAVRAGVPRDYYESGQLEGEYNFKDGKPEGVAKTYYENGQLQGEVNFKNGIMISQKRYDSDGNLESDQDYTTK